MSRRNFILLIILLIITVMVVLGFLYSRQPTNTTTDTGGTNFFATLNPFGKKTPTPPSVTPPVDISAEPSSVEEIPKIKLRKVSSMPIAGYGVYKKERLKDIPVPNPTPALPLSGEGVIISPPAKGGSGGLKTKPTAPPTEFVTALRYVERTTGNIYQTFADKIEEKKFSGTIIPKIYEAYFGNNATSVIMRYLKGNGQTITTFAGNLPKELLGGDTTEDNEVKGIFLPDNIGDISISPDALKTFYLFNIGDSVIGTTFNLSDNKKAQVFDSPFTEWLSQWPKSSLITLTTKPSSNVPGYMYAVDLNKKYSSKTLGGINGLTTLTSPDGKLVLYTDSSLSLYVYDMDTRNSNSLAIRTLPEKCVWGRLSDTVYCATPKSITISEYPDNWYQGKVSFSDQLWKINVVTKNTTMIADSTIIAGEEEVDGIKLALDTDENYLFFVNKKDSFLWELELK